jgi:hypothetical protein
VTPSRARGRRADVAHTLTAASLEYEIETGGNCATRGIQFPQTSPTITIRICHRCVPPGPAAGELLLLRRRRLLLLLRVEPSSLRRPHNSMLGEVRQDPYHPH